MSHDRESGQPRLPVDRVFTMKGFGTVVTGTSSGGTFETGQDVEVLPGGEQGRIRGLQSHGHTVHVIEPGRRTAMNLSGIERSSLVRGNVVSLPGLMRTTRRVDGLVRVLSSAPKPLKTMDMLSFHAGSAEATARVFPLESRQIEPGHSGWAQLRFDRPLTLWRRQRGVLRQMSPARTVAGAQVMDLVPRRRAREEDSTHLAGLQSEDIHEVIVALVSDRGRTASDLCCLLSIAPNRLDPLLASLHSQGRLEAIGDLYVTAVQANKLRDRVLTIVREFHSTYQLRMGITREELRRRAGISARGLADLVDSLVEAGRLTTIKNTFALPTHRAGETDGADDPPGLSDLAIALRDSGLMPPGIAELRKRYDVDEEGLRYLVDRGVVVRIQSDIYVAGPAYERMTNAVVDLIDSEGQVTIARIRDSLGVTRKYALAYAEHLDARHITRRVGDERVAGPEFHAHRT
jgi:selenocysteine-specific elongation factor